MKLFSKSSNILKAGLFAVAIALGSANYLQAKFDSDSQAQLLDLTTVSNAYAEGSIECGTSGSGCKFTVNGAPYTSTTHKEK